MWTYAIELPIICPDDRLARKNVDSRGLCFDRSLFDKIILYRIPMQAAEKKTTENVLYSLLKI